MDSRLRSFPDHPGLTRARDADDQLALQSLIRDETILKAVGHPERVRLLSHVYVAAYRPPLATAKAFSTLDEVSDGRVILRGRALSAEDKRRLALPADAEMISVDRNLIRAIKEML